MSDGNFTPEQRRMLEDLGWVMEYDLVGEVYVRLCYDKTDLWAWISPNGSVGVIKTSNISDALGTY